MCMSTENHGHQQRQNWRMYLSTTMYLSTENHGHQQRQYWAMYLSTENHGHQQRSKTGQCAYQLRIMAINKDSTRLCPCLQSIKAINKYRTGQCAYQLRLMAISKDRTGECTCQLQCTCQLRIIAINKVLGNVHKKLLLLC